MKPLFRPLAFYVNPREPELEMYIAWLAEHGVGLLGTNSIPLGEQNFVPRVTALLEKHDMRMVSVHSEIGLLSPDGDDAQLRPLFRPALERAREWNAECIVYHFRSIQQPWKDAIWWEENAYIQSVGVEAIDRRLEDVLTWLCEEAAKLGVGIALENVQSHFAFAYRVDEIAALVRRVGAPNLGLCLDSGHAHLSGVDVASAVRLAGDKLMTTHFHDTFAGRAPRDMIHEVDLHLVPGLGTINWPAVLRAMDEIGYEAPITFEGPRIPGEADSRRAWELTMTTWAAFEKLAAGVG